MSLRFPTLLTMLAIVLSACVVAPTSAQAPAPPDGSRLRDALDVTDRRIQLARDLLATSPNAAAAAEVDHAVALQAIAKDAFAQGRFAAAGRATFDARIHADRAIAMLRGLPDPGRVQEQLGRTRELLDRARDRLAHCELPAARELLRTALDMQARAEQAYGETRYLAALQLTMSARERALRAQQLCNAGESFDETVGNALQRTDAILARAHELLDAGGTERARSLLANAAGVQGRARTEERAGRARTALRLTRLAREQAERSMRGAAMGGRR